MTINQIPATTVNVVADGPAFGHGDNDAKPSPDPINTITSVIDEAAMAPPNIAGHDIADTDDSAVTRESAG